LYYKTNIILAGLTLCTIYSAYAENTVRTGAQASQSFNSLENARTLYIEMMNVISGETSILDAEMSEVEQRLSDLRRQINNLQPVMYATETVYIGAETWTGGGDDGGSGAGGGGSCG
jgi:hypothetical protein